MKTRTSSVIFYPIDHPDRPKGCFVLVNLNTKTPDDGVSATDVAYCDNDGNFLTSRYGDAYFFKNNITHVARFPNSFWNNSEVD